MTEFHSQRYPFFSIFCWVLFVNYLETMGVEKQSDDTSSDDYTRKAVDCRKERGKRSIYK